MASVSPTSEQSASPEVVLPPEVLPDVSNLVTEEEVLPPLPPEARPNIEHLVTEDDAPVENIFSEKQQRLLTESLYTSWRGPEDERPFLTLANVGLFYSVHRPPLVPDVLLSLDVEVPADVWTKHNRSYFMWEMGKPPEVVFEIVSNQKGREADYKLKQYAKIGVAYYVIFDPARQLSDEVLRIYGRKNTVYAILSEQWLPDVGLGLTLWPGTYEGKEDVWLRWCDREGQLIATGVERAEQEHQRAEQERQRAERLAAQLRDLGVEPEV
jgi:Uma2 family endonuclease